MHLKYKLALNLCIFKGKNWTYTEKLKPLPVTHSWDKNLFFRVRKLWNPCCLWLLGTFYQRIGVKTQEFDYFCISQSFHCQTWKIHLSTSTEEITISQSVILWARTAECGCPRVHLVTHQRPTCDILCIYFLLLSHTISSCDANTQVLQSKGQSSSLTPFQKLGMEEMPGLKEWVSHRIPELQVT